MELKILIKGILKGLQRALILTFILIGILCLAMFFKEINVKILNIIWTTITCLSVVYGAVVAVIKSEKNGWLVGLIFGAIYFCVIFIISKFIFKNNLDMALFNFTKLIIFMIIGMLAGMLGINL